MLHFIKDFFLCGAFGWCMECFWSGLDCIRKKKDRALHCSTSVWMFPIYGMAALLRPLSRLMKGKSAMLRGSVYTMLIYLGEFLSGTMLKKMKACPWDYSKAKLNYKGIVRLDYAPAWFLSGLVFEKILLRDGKTEINA